ncbi:TPA: hypothetical protein I0I20_RS13185 [Enterococcus faecium]
MKIIREKIQVEEFSYFKICYSEGEENILSPTLKKNHQNCYELCLHVHLIIDSFLFWFDLRKTSPETREYGNHK